MIASLTIPATMLFCCWASQVDGKSVPRERRATHHSAGATATATTVSSGESVSITASEMTNSSRLPSVIGAMASSPWTIVMSDVARLITCPVLSSSCRRPSSLDSASNTSMRRSCWTSRASRPPAERRA